MAELMINGLEIPGLLTILDFPSVPPLFCNIYMLPPEDDNQDDATRPEPEPRGPDAQAVLAPIPADFYEQLAPLLQLCAVANFLLMGRSSDPVPLAITQLTGFDLATAARISRVRDTESLGRLLLDEPKMLYDYLQVGTLVFESPLFDHVAQLLSNHGTTDGEAVADSLRGFVVELGEAMLASLAQCIEQDAELGQDLHLRHLQLESIFARLADTLVPLQLPATDDADADDLRPRLRLCFPAVQLAALQVALMLPVWLEEDAGHGFTSAIVELGRQRYLAIDALQQRLQALAPEQDTELSLSELSLLYQAAQVYALALVTGVLDSSTEAASLFAPDSETTLPAYCAELERFVQLVQATFPEEPVLVAARREVEALAELL